NRHGSRGSSFLSISRNAIRCGTDYSHKPPGQHPGDDRMFGYYWQKQYSISGWHAGERIYPGCDPRSIDLAQICRGGPAKPACGFYPDTRFKSLLELRGNWWGK